MNYFYTYFIYDPHTNNPQAKTAKTGSDYIWENAPGLEDETELEDLPHGNHISPKDDGPMNTTQDQEGNKESHARLTTQFSQTTSKQTAQQTAC